MIESKEKRRKHKRYILDGINGNVCFSSDLKVVNISFNGLAIETKRWLKLDREYIFRIVYKKTSLILKGRIVWAFFTQGKKINSDFVPVYKAGVKFSDIISNNACVVSNFKSFLLDKTPVNAFINNGEL